ncbi:MAG: uroporphyrinogen-III C-methyltransferase [Bacteroidota bacterium]|nr:uroporphyrinogen-III C-methyltransferase [Bacteroidota bacterium]
MDRLHQHGKVIMAGAGPGDPDLITLKLQKYLQTSDVILVDRLVNPEIIRRNVRPDTLIIQCGKQGFNDSSSSQADINQQMVTHAIAGRTVVRLKGGDVAFFSNMLDELCELRKNNIPYEIIPGITAASGASAYTSIPLTARGYAQGVQFITLNPNIDFTLKQWDAIATTTDTLVFYMSAKNILHLGAKLLDHGSTEETALAIIEQATTIYQQVHISTLRDVKRDFERKEFSSPSLVIVGRVVDLHHKFSWFNPTLDGSVFQELKNEINTN